MRIKAKNKPGTMAYFDEPYTAQHFVNWLWQTITAIPRFIWFMFRHYTSETFRIETARRYNQALLGNIPTNQIHVIDKDTGHYRPLREDERTWPE